VGESRIRTLISLGQLYSTTKIDMERVQGEKHGFYPAFSVIPSVLHVVGMMCSSPGLHGGMLRLANSLMSVPKGVEVMEHRRWVRTDGRRAAVRDEYRGGGDERAIRGYQPIGDRGG
jgi:hypothetical protein